MEGENGTGKSTFILLLAGLLKPDSESNVEIPEFNVSYKPQKISPKFTRTVRDLLHMKIRDSYTHPQFVSDVMKLSGFEATSFLKRIGFKALSLSKGSKFDA
ncbi:putative P-loop containing nucleoside triphosphate hydrolase [Rosa chinensis]|uniref:Putative P-loop containing nucleoside triphosphate hydrolase n=1 Tax=Rosa chinensis TaxID=74649 RepID=A0A2P6Q359_ROSCH|nr:putative P-loop containing nucleoside triphosphate hydrolase [Rosa chinensis]